MLLPAGFTHNVYEIGAYVHLGGLQGCMGVSQHHHMI